MAAKGLRKMHNMRLHEKYFNLIIKGTKTIELRLRDEKRRLIQIGDEIEFSQTNNPTQKCLKQVKNLYMARNFEELCSQINVADAGFETADELIEVLSEFYPLEIQNKYGVLAIELA